MFTNAPTDQVSLTPWKQRLARNGSAVHEFFQRDLVKMQGDFTPVMFVNRYGREQFEHVGEKTWDVGGTLVILSGRCDGQFHDKATGSIVGFEFKSADKAKKLTKVRRIGPEAYHREQVAAYSLIWPISRWLLVYEMLQKPEWSNDDGDDLALFTIDVTPEEQRSLLLRLAGVVESVEALVAPPGEFGKCNFCVFKGACAVEEAKKREA